MKNIRIGTRGSPLALIQTQEVMDKLLEYHPFLKGRLEVIPIKTAGDTIMDRSLIDLGGKSLFTKEIEHALLKEEIDLAVHSMKDVTVDCLEGLLFPAMLEREDPRDALISRGGIPFETLPKGTLFGTSSLRRQAYVLNKFPHVTPISLRGNVSTRIEKVKTGEVDATLLAVAGLKRLGLMNEITQILSLEDCLPAVAQGAIGIQCREKDFNLLEILSPINHPVTFATITAERAFMKTLNGSCRTPVAAYATFEGETLTLKGMICNPNGHNMRFVTHKGLASHSKKIGCEAANILLKEGTCPTFS
ncbi:hydroxymethylbilane synthase [Kamptonema cortianum]|jgi:hydroxymethylbilane synthase|nr:hydroxymethylbilane synthase [Kamptonema cortianum]